MLNQDTMTTIMVAVITMAIGWGAWVSTTIFKHAQEIALMKQHMRLLTEEIVLLKEVKEVLNGIKHRLGTGH